jgi:hypothetical protein
MSRKERGARLIISGKTVALSMDNGCMFKPKKQRVEIIRQQFTAEGLFDLIENSGVREALRKYQPQCTYVFVDCAGQVEGVARARESLTQEEHAEATAGFPKTAFFITGPGRYDSAKEIAGRIAKCAEALNMPMPRTFRGGALLKIGGKWVPSLAAKLLARKKN